MTTEGLREVITRNTYEVAHALLEWQVLRSIEYCSVSWGLRVAAENFVTIANRAIFNDMLAHTIKVLDSNQDSATFWVVQKEIPGPVKKLRSFSQAKIDFLHTLAPRLKLVRDKTHFHIDKEAVRDPAKIWAEAGITGDELQQGLVYLWEMLRELHEVICGREFRDVVSEYDGKEVGDLLEWARSKKIVLTTADVIREIGIDNSDMGRNPS